MSDEDGSWNWANVQSAGGGCLIVGDQLYFYVSGRQGRPGTDAPGVCSTGLATLRRDGFASMDWMPDRAPVMRSRAIRRHADDARRSRSPANICSSTPMSARRAARRSARRIGRGHRAVHARGLRADHRQRHEAADARGATCHRSPGEESQGAPQLLDDARPVCSVLGQRAAAGESGGYPAAGGPSSPARSIAERLMRTAAGATARRTQHGRRGIAHHPRARTVLHVRLGAAPVGLAGHRPVSRARQGAGARRAIRHHRRAVGLRLLRRGVLLGCSAIACGCRCWRRSSSTPLPRSCSIAWRSHSVGARTATLAALILGIFSFNTVYASTQASDAVCTVLFLCSLRHRSPEARASGSMVDMAIGGLLSGLVPQFRPNMILLPALLAAGYVLIGRTRGAPRRARSSSACGRDAGVDAVDRPQLPPDRIRSCRPARMAACNCGTARCRSGPISKAAPTIRDRSSTRRRCRTPASPESPIVIRARKSACAPADEVPVLVYWTDRQPARPACRPPPLVMER